MHNLKNIQKSPWDYFQTRIIKSFYYDVVAIVALYIAW